MATPSTGQISYSDVRAEITTSTTEIISLKNALPLAMVYGETPTSQHDLSEWYNTTAKPGEDFGTTLYDVYDVSESGSYAQALVSFLSDGTFFTRKYAGGSQTTTYYDWSPLGAFNAETAGEYQIKWVFNSGTVTPGTGVSSGGTWDSQNTWYTLSSGSRWIQVTDTTWESGTTFTATITVTIRPYNNANLEVSQQFTLRCYYGILT